MSEPSIGDNQLKSVVARINTLEDEKKSIADDIKDVYAEAKGNGFDVKQLRRAVAISRQDQGKREEAEAILETYLVALGIRA